MNKILLILLLVASIFTVTACVRGGNVDKGGDGNIGDEDGDGTENAVITDDPDDDFFEDDVDDPFDDDLDDDLDDDRNDGIVTDGNGTDDNLGERIRRGVEELTTLFDDDMTPTPNVTDGSNGNIGYDNNGNAHQRGAQIGR